MSLTIGSAIPSGCGSSGLVGNLMLRKLKGVSNFLQVDDTLLGMVSSSANSAAAIGSNIQTCAGAGLDPFQSDFQYGQPGRILRAYIHQDTGACGGPTNQVLNSSSGFSSSFGSFNWVVFFGFNIGVQPAFAGEAWRIVNSSIGDPNPSAIVASGSIDGAGNLVGLSVTPVGPSWRVDYTALGPTGGFSGSPYYFHYFLQVRCAGIWATIPNL